MTTCTTREPSPNGKAPARLPKPKALPVRSKHIPAELRDRPHWIVWKYTWQEDQAKWIKPPYDARTGRRASSTDPSDLPQLVEAIGRTPLVGLDLKTTGPSPIDHEIRLISLDCAADEDRVVYLVDCFKVDPAPLFDVLSASDLVAHNAAFVLAFLSWRGFVPDGAVRDSRLLSQLLHGTRRPKGFYSLAACTRRELGVELDKGEQRSDWGGDLTPRQLEYAARDVQVLRPLHEALNKKIEETGLGRVASLEQRALPAVVSLGCRGVALDVGAWEALADAAEAEELRSRQELDRAAPPKPGNPPPANLWNWNSPAQVKEALGLAGVNVPDAREETLAATDHPLARALLDHRWARKLAGTYGRGWLEKHVAADGRVHAGWQQIGADSGRMACQEPCLQDLPRDVRYRRCFVAPPGRVLVKGSFSQLDLRIAAKVAGEERMIEACRQGHDLHTLTARLVLGKENITKQERQLARALNNELLYGMGALRFSENARAEYGLVLTVAQAREFRAAFFRAYPALRRWHRSVPGGTVETRTLAGRRRLGVEWFTEKLSSPVQGTGADGLKAALALLWERRAEVPGAFPVLAVHDEIVVERDGNRAEDVEAWLRQAMVEGMAPLIQPVPIEVEVSVGTSWGSGQ
jgi:DNA polymerase-1